MTRTEALKFAREHVAELYTTKNDKGYPRWNPTSEQILQAELRVASFLIEGDDD